MTNPNLDGKAEVEYSDRHFTRADKSIAALAGLGLLVASLSQTATGKKVTASLGSAVDSSVGYIDVFQRFGTYSTQTYTPQQRTLEIRTSPLELSGGNPLVAEYIRLSAGVPSVGIEISSGKIFNVLVQDENGTPGYKLLAELEASK